MGSGCESYTIVRPPWVSIPVTNRSVWVTVAAAGRGARVDTSGVERPQVHGSDADEHTVLQREREHASLTMCPHCMLCIWPQIYAGANLYSRPAVGSKDNYDLTQTQRAQLYIRIQLCTQQCCSS
jgi:hypothetical protein